MRLKIKHHTSYRYEQPVDFALQQLRLTPKSSGNQQIITWAINIAHGNKELEFEDHNHNTVDLISFEVGQSELVIDCEGEVETMDTAGITGKHRGFAPLWYFLRSTDLTKAGTGIRKLVRSVTESGDDEISQLHNLSDDIRKQVSYETGSSDVKTSAEEVITEGRGVCQDHAHVFLSAARLMGYSARYVSGYLMMNDRETQNASHAWVEVWINDVGWTGFDVSNGISPDERYVQVATGLDYLEAAPVSGMRFGDGPESMQVKLMVQQ